MRASTDFASVHQRGVVAKNRKLIAFSGSMGYEYTVKLAICGEGDCPRPLESADLQCQTENEIEVPRRPGRPYDLPRGKPLIRPDHYGFHANGWVARRLDHYQ